MYCRLMTINFCPKASLCPAASRPLSPGLTHVDLPVFLLTPEEQEGGQYPWAWLPASTCFRHHGLPSSPSLGAWREGTHPETFARSPDPPSAASGSRLGRGLGLGAPVLGGSICFQLTPSWPPGRRLPCPAWPGSGSGEGQAWGA